MNRFISKAVTFVTMLLMLTAAVMPVQAVGSDGATVSVLSTPVLSEIAVFSGKFELKLNNPDDYDKETVFEIAVDGEKTSRTTIEKLAGKNYVFEITGGTSYFAPETKHTVRVRASADGAVSAWSKTFTAVTAEKTIYYSAKGRTYYKLTKSGMVRVDELEDAGYFTAVLCDVDGNNCEGKNKKTNPAKFILITEGELKGYYLNVSLVRRKTAAQAAAAAPVKPKLTEAFNSADKLGIGISNLSDYRDATVFNVYVDGKKLKTVKLEAVKRDGYISIYSDPAKYLKKSTSYKISAEAVSRQLTSAKTTKTLTTGSTTYFRLKKGITLYTLKNGKFKSNGAAGYATFGEGIRVDASGKAIAGRSASSVSGTYVKLTSGDCKGSYVKASSVYRTTKAATQVITRQNKIDKVVAYAMANVGGAYVSCGTRFRATDCSGLTMLAYQQIGVSLPHSAYGQMLLGKRVSASEMQPGDIIVANGYNHAMMYVGNGMVVHAMNWRDGIRMQAASTAMYYNPVNAIVRII